MRNYKNDFDHNSCQELDNHGIILQGFLSEFWLPALVSNNSDDYRILQELGDREILRNQMTTEFS